MVYSVGSCAYAPVLNWSQLFRLEKVEKVEKQKFNIAPTSFK